MTEKLYVRACGLLKSTTHMHGLTDMQIHLSVMAVTTATQVHMSLSRL